VPLLQSDCLEDNFDLDLAPSFQVVAAVAAEAFGMAWVVLDASEDSLGVAAVVEGVSFDVVFAAGVADLAVSLAAAVAA
jgi:hypothetical protein